ncbi:ABC transporter substrate-binding protein [Halosegnis sp.]|uniref:ABC transporter substrate-binding protein n=1 Tax=Halosegnis sp. TaxID=2864959 RepID=UPI0035D52570
MPDIDIDDVIPEEVDDEWSLSRRQAMALGGAAGLAGLAGCSGGGGGSEGGSEGGDSGSNTDTGTSGGGGDSGGGEVHVLTDYNNEAWQKKWENKLVPAFEEQSDYTVRMEYSGFSGDQESRLANLVQSGDPPGFNTSTFEQVGDLFLSDQLAEVGDVVADAEEVAGELTTKPYHEGDKYWQVTHGGYASVLHYRQDVYDELGLEVPTTFQELLENARIIDESDLDIRGYGLAGSKTGKAHDEFQVFLSNMGASELRFEDPEAKENVEVWFPEEEITTLLEYFKELSQYSPDPTNVGWGASLRNWAGGQFAQQYNLNMWPAGVAAAVGANKIAKNTEVAPLPLWEEGGITKEDSYLSNPTPDGHNVFAEADNTQGAKEFLRFLYGSETNRTARMYETEPTRFLPAYGDVVDSDAFQNYGLWEKFPGILEGLQRVNNEIVPEYYGNVEGSGVLSNSKIGVYYYRFFFQAEMINQVVTETSTPQEAYEFGLQRANEVVKEARSRIQ